MPMNHIYKHSSEQERDVNLIFTSCRASRSGEERGDCSTAGSAVLPEFRAGLIRMINFRVISTNAITTTGRNPSSLTAQEGWALDLPVGQKQASSAPALVLQGLLNGEHGLTTLPVEA